MTADSALLLRAANARSHSSDPEDRLTEIFRAVLITAPSLLSWLVAKGLGRSSEEAERLCSAGQYEVDTQASVAGGGRPDMQIHLADGSRLYCENKIKAGWTRWQSLGYPAIPSSDRVAVLSPSGRLPEELPSSERPKFIAVRWQDLAEAADAIGRSHSGGAGWRERAMGPDARAELRLLAEFLWYLEREDVDVSVVTPITDEDLAVLPAVDPVVVRWKHFRKAVCRQARGARPDLELRKRWDPEHRSRGSVAFRLVLAEGSGWDGVDWAAVAPLLTEPKRSWEELILSPQALWMDQQKPFVAVGVGLRGSRLQANASERWLEVVEAVDSAGGWVGYTDRGKTLRLVLSRPLEELIAGEQTVESQASAVVKWSVGALMQLQAPDGPRPIKSGPQP